MAETPKPGSPDAVSQGCTCPVEDNGGGAGQSWDATGARFFWLDAGCPVHDPAASSPQEPDTR